MVTLTLFDLNPVKLDIIHSWLVTIIVLEIVKSHHQKYVLQKKQRTNVKAFNMITNKSEVKAMTKHVSCNCKCKVNSTTNRLTKLVNENVKVMIHAKKIIVGILAHVFVRIANI